MKAISVPVSDVKAKLEVEKYGLKNVEHFLVLFILRYRYRYSVFQCCGYGIIVPGQARIEEQINLKFVH